VPTNVHSQRVGRVRDAVRNEVERGEVENGIGLELADRVGQKIAVGYVSLRKYKCRVGSK
jgi:hypothetical protein